MSPEFDYISVNLRNAVRDRARNHCEYCVCPANYCPDSFTIDHTKPRQSGGPTTLENLAWSCHGCNSFKHVRTTFTDPETQQEISLFNPRQQSWSEHFQWNVDCTQMIGLTACGRATIVALKLNRPNVINLRRLLANAQLHPPSWLLESD
ncbi:HNH endonuclease [Alkalinema pantanalense CENA528]|uniref:HNH endonuclease n=1 Tax=Alkalinema pantanalense TaxID=1620705 RepID=UPI003D6F85A3